MKYIYFFITFMVIFNVSFFSFADNIDHVEFRNILNDFNSVMRFDEKSELYKKFALIKDKTQNQEITFRIDKLAPRSIYGGAGFTPKGVADSKESYFVISPYLIEIYPKYPSVVLSILFHEFFHAYSYYENPGYFMYYRDNSIDKYLFEFDATYSEAMFISKYLIPKKYNLTKFEKYIYDAFRNNKLRSASMYLHMYDYNIAYSFYETRISSETNSKKISKLEKIGESVLLENSISAKDNQETKYKKLISLITFKNMISQTVFDIIADGGKNKIDPTKFELKNYGKLDEIKTSVAKILSNDEIDFCIKLREEFLTSHDL